MDEMTSLLLVVLVIYLLECLVWIRRNGVCLSRFFSKTYSVVLPGRIAGNQSGAFSVANPLPPFGPAFVLSPWPMSLSPAFILAYRGSAWTAGGRPKQTGNILSWSAVQRIEREGKNILLNGAHFCGCAHIGQAVDLVAFLRELKAMNENERAERIDQWFRTAFDEKEIRDRIAQGAAAARLSLLLSVVLFGYVFFLAPLSIWYFGISRWIVPMVGLLLAQTIAQGIIYHRRHALLHPAWSDARFTTFLTMLLAPPTAIRAADHLQRFLLHGYHPVVIARLLAHDEPFREFAALVYRDAVFPLLPACPLDADEAQETERWFREKETSMLTTSLKGAGVDPAQFLAAPVLYPGNLSYCPRCRTQFQKTDAVCHDCGGRPVEAVPTVTG